jgi:hypothetical protein
VSWITEKEVDNQFLSLSLRHRTHVAKDQIPVISQLHKKNAVQICITAGHGRGHLDPEGAPAMYMSFAE